MLTSILEHFQKRTSSPYRHLPTSPLTFLFFCPKKKEERGCRWGWGRPGTHSISPPPHRLRGPNNSHGHTEKIRPTDTLTFRGASHWISSFSTVCHRMSVSRKKIYGCGTRPLWNPDKQECRTGTSEFKYLLSSQFDPGKCNFLNLSKCQLLKLSFTQITHRVDSFSLTSWKLTSRLWFHSI